MESKSSGGKSENQNSKSEAESEEANCQVLVKQLNKCVERDLLTRFVRTFLLDTNATNIRWQAHALVLAIYKYVPLSCHVVTHFPNINIMYCIWVFVTLAIAGYIMSSTDNDTIVI